MYVNNDGDMNRQSIYSFYGLNRTRKGTRSEFEDMKNMSSKEYPCASPRGRRKTVAEVEGNIQAVVPPDSTVTDNITAFTGVKDDIFYYNGVRKTSIIPYYVTNLSMARAYAHEIALPTGCEWTIHKMGRTYIMNAYNPDKVRSYLFYYDPVTDEFGYGGNVMSHLVVGFDTKNSDGSGMYFKLCPMAAAESYRDNSELPQSIRDVASDYLDLYFRKSASSPEGLPTDKNVFSYFFNIGDELIIDGFPDFILYNGVKEQYNLSSLNFLGHDNKSTTKYISEKERFSVVVDSFGSVNGISNNQTMYVRFVNKNNKDLTWTDATTFYASEVRYAPGVTIAKKQPTFTTIGTHHNRIWGMVPLGTMVYASAADDIFSFSSSDLVNMYAAYVTANTSGLFTAMCPYNGDMVAFKEDSITVISGTNATNYYADTLEGIGCIDGKSVAQTTEGIIFLSRRGFYIYNGSYPQKLSDKLNTLYTSAVAGYNGKEYLACATRADNGERELVKYDMERGLWHKEDGIDAKGIFPFKGKTYIADASKIYECDNPDGLSVEWEMTSVLLRDNTLDSKAISEIWILAEVSPNACFKVWTQTDGGEWQMHSAFTEEGLNLYRCPVKGTLGTNYRYKISGAGEVVIYEIELVNADTDSRRHKEREGTVNPVNRPDNLLIYN